MIFFHILLIFIAGFDWMGGYPQRIPMGYNDSNGKMLSKMVPF